MRDFYEPIYGSYQTPPAFQQAQEHLKKSGSSSSGGGGGSSSSSTVLGRFLKLGKSKSDANGHGLKNRSRPSSSYNDDFEEDFRLTSTKSPVERMVQKVNARKDVSKSHSWIYGSVKLPSDLPFGYGYTSGYGPGNSPSQMHIPRCQNKMDYCGSCDCTSDFDFVTPAGASNSNGQSHNHNHNHNHNQPPPPHHLPPHHRPHHNHPPPGPGMDFEGNGNCPGCHPYYGAIECGKQQHQQLQQQLWLHPRKEKDSSQLTMLENGKKFGNSVRKLTWKSLKQVVKKRPTLDVLKKSATPSPSSMYSSHPSTNSPQDMSSGGGGSHDDLLGSNYFFPEKKSFYASCTDLYGETPPHVTASVRVRPKRARQPWPFPNEFGPVPNYQEEEIYHSEWDLRQFMPYDVWLTATNNPHLNPASIASTSNSATKIPKINRALPPSGSSNNINSPTNPTNNPNSSPATNNNNNNSNSPSSNNNNNNNNNNTNNNNVIKNKGMGSSSAIYGYGQAIVKRSSILHPDVTAYQLIKSQQRGTSHMKEGKDKAMDHAERAEQSDSDDLSDNVLTEDPVRIGGQGIYMVSTVNPSSGPNNANSNPPTKSNSNSIICNTSSSSSSSNSNSLGSRKIVCSGDVGGGGWAERHQSTQSSKQVKHMSPDRSNNSSRVTDLYESPSSSVSNASSTLSNANGLKTYLSHSAGAGSSGHYGPSTSAAPGKKFNHSNSRQMNDKSGGDRIYGETKNNATSENHQDYLSSFESVSYDSSSPSEPTTTSSKSHETSSAAVGPTNSTSTSASGNKYGALKRRKSRNGSSNKQNLFKETIYEEDSEHSEELQLPGKSKEVHTVKIVVSQTVTSEYVKPILKKERVYETPSVEGRGVQFHANSSASSPHPSSQDANGLNPSNNYGDVCSDGQQSHLYGHHHQQQQQQQHNQNQSQYQQPSTQNGGTRSTKKVQFDQTKLVVCGGLSEEDDGDESDDTLVKDYGDDKESDWIVEEPSAAASSQMHSKQKQMQMESHIPNSNASHLAADNDSTPSASVSQISFDLQGKSISALEEVVRSDGVNNPLGFQSKSGHSMSAYKGGSSGPSAIAGNAHSETHHGTGSSSSNSISERLSCNSASNSGRGGPTITSSSAVAAAADRSSRAPQDHIKSAKAEMGIQKQGADEKLRIQSRKHETPHVASLKAERIANVPERKTVKVSSGEKIINPNSLLFHDTTRIRLNQTRPSIEQTFKLNLSNQPGGSSKGGSGNVSKNSAGGVSRMMSRIKQSSSFRNPVGSAALRPREPPPPPPVPLHASSRSSVASPGVSAYAEPQNIPSQQQQQPTVTTTKTSTTVPPTKVGFSKQSMSRTIGSSAASSKLQKTLSNIAKIDRRPTSSSNKSAPSPSQTESRSSSSSISSTKTEISHPMGCPSTMPGKNGAKTRSSIDETVKGVESSANSNSSNSNSNGGSSRAPTSNGNRKSPLGPDSSPVELNNNRSSSNSGSNNNNNVKNNNNIKLPPTRSKSLAERCKAVEKVLAQHSPFPLPSSPQQSHEEKSVKELPTRSSNHNHNNNLTKNILAPNPASNPPPFSQGKTTTTMEMISNGNDNGPASPNPSQDALSTCNRRSSIENTNVSTNSHYFPSVENESFPVTMSHSTNNIRTNANNICSSTSSNLSSYDHQNYSDSREECIYDDTAKNIEIVTKENSVSEIRIYSGTQNLNINHSSEAARILSKFSGREGCNSKPSQDNKIEEIHYAATDVLYSVGNQTESQSGIHFRQASAPSSLHSSRPHSTSVVLIIDTGSNQQQQQQQQLSSAVSSMSLMPTSNATSSNPSHFDEHKSFLDPAPPAPSLPAEKQVYRTCLTTEGRATTRQTESESEEPLYDDVINHSSRQQASKSSTSANSAVNEGKRNSISGFSLKELTEKTANALTKTYSKNLNKFPLPPPPPVPSIPPPPLLLPPSPNNTTNNNNNSSSKAQEMDDMDNESDNLYNDIELSLPAAGGGGGGSGAITQTSFSGGSNGPINYGGREGLIYDDTLSVVSSNYGRSIIDGKMNGLIEVDEDEPLYDDVLNLLHQDSDSGAETEDSPPPPLPAQGPPVHLLPKVSMDLPLLNFPLLQQSSEKSSSAAPALPSTINTTLTAPSKGSTLTRSTALSGRRRASETKEEDVTVRGARDEVVAGDLCPDPKSFMASLRAMAAHSVSLEDHSQGRAQSLSHNNNNNNGNHNNGVESSRHRRTTSSNNSTNDVKAMTDLNGFLQTLSPSCSSSSSAGSSTTDIPPSEMEEDDVLDRTRTLLNELNDKLNKLNFPSADYSTYISKVVISSSSESSGVEEDYNSEKNYSLSNSNSEVACFDENYRLSAVSKLVSETISMARGKFLDSMKLPTLGTTSSSSGNSSGSGCVVSGLVSHGGSGGHGVGNGLLLGDMDEPIYEEIGDLNRSTSPIYADAFDAKSIFDGASRNEILSFLESIRDRLAAAETNSTDSAASSLTRNKKVRKIVDIERNDSGIGSESGSLVAVNSSKSSASHRLCSDCNDAPVDPRLVTTSSLTTVNGEVSSSGSGSNNGNSSNNNSINSRSGGQTRGLNLCRSCTRKRSERKEILQEIYETELKYGRDLKIIEDEFYNPIQIAGLLTKEQLDQIFLNVDQLVEINLQLTSMLKSSIDAAQATHDDDLTTVNVGKIFIDYGETMMSAFESYCTRQANAGALLTQLEKEKELLRIFLRVSQMENTVLRRMNLPAFLMVPVQRVTRYPLLLARLLKVTPVEHFSREEMYSAQQKIEQHLEHMNKTTREVASVKLWRRISIMNGSSSPVHRRSNSDLDGAVLRIRKMALDVLDWANFNDVTCVIESQLNVVQFNGKTLRNIYGCLLARGKDLESLACKMEQDVFFPPAEDVVKDVKLVLVRVKNTRFCLLREPLCLSKCVISQGENEFQDFIEINEIITKNTYYFQGMEKHGTLEWLRLLQCHAVCVGQWRRRRGALANIMMNGMIRHV